MPESRTELLRGTLDLLILRALTLNCDHGVGIARRIHQISKGTFDVKPGSLFPALHRLEEKGWSSSEWGESENFRRAKYYKLTKSGRKQIQNEMANWGRVIMRKIASFLRNSFRKKRMEQDLDDEIRFYLETTAQNEMASGMSEDDARRAARLQLGSVDSLKDSVRDIRTGALSAAYMAL